MKTSKFRASIAVIVISICAASTCHAQAVAEQDNDVTIASPKAGWALPIPPQQESRPTWEKILLWLPNRVMDFVDIFRVDVGVGPSVGAVVRVTEYGQLGYRQMLPASLRVGDFGRDSPIVLETSNELGAGPAFKKSADRTVCDGEIGVGADVFIAGAYAGVCLDEFADFVAGLLFIDLKDDDF